MNMQGPWTDRSRNGWPHGGFTLVELIVVIALISVLATVGVPGLKQSLDRNRAVSAMMELHALLNLARQTAVTRNVEVTVCGVDQDMKCIEPWQGHSTLVFIDRNHNRRVDPNELITANSHLTRDGQIRWRASGGRDYLRYHRTGAVKDIGTFGYCPWNESQAIAGIIINKVGRPRAAPDTDLNGYIENGSGRAIEC